MVVSGGDDQRSIVPSPTNTLRGSKVIGGVYATHGNNHLRELGPTRAVALPAMQAAIAPSFCFLNPQVVRVTAIRKLRPEELVKPAHQVSSDQMERQAQV